jgi:hypothetical protein
VRLDGVAASPRDLGDHAGKAAVLDSRRPTAARTDDVVVVGGRARDVRVLAGREIEALDNVKLRQEIERPEERRPTDPESPAARGRLELGRGEVAVVFGDEIGDREARRGKPIAGSLERIDDGIGWVHDGDGRRPWRSCRESVAIGTPYTHESAPIGDSVAVVTILSVGEATSRGSRIWHSAM